MATNYNDQFSGSGSPPTPVDAVTGAGETLAYKAPCRLATTGDVVLSGLQTIDGVLTAAGDRVLVLTHPDATRNGIYIAAAGTWQRARDFDTNRDITKGTRVAVTDGMTLTGKEYQIASDNPINLGTSDITFVETLSSAGGAVESVNGKIGAVVLGADDVLTGDGETVGDELDDHEGRIVDVEAEQASQSGDIADHEARISSLETTPAGAIRQAKVLSLQGATWSNVGATVQKTSPVTIQSAAGRRIRVSLDIASLIGSGGSGSGSHTYTLGVFRDNAGGGSELRQFMTGSVSSSASGPTLVNELGVGTFILLPLQVVVPVSDGDPHDYAIGLYRSSGSDNTRDFAVNLQVLFEEIAPTP